MKRIHISWIIPFTLAAALIGAWAIGIDDLFPPPWPDAPLAPHGPAPEDALPFTDSISAESCSKCHEKQYKEWEESMHRNSFVDPINQATLQFEGMEFCSGCHLPMTEQTPAFVSFGEGGAPIVDPNPDFQPELMSEGVTCAVCHLREWVRHGPPHEGETEEDASQIHQVRFMEDYEKAEFCAKCHQEELHHIPGTPMEVIPPGETVVWDNTYGEWQAWQESLPEDHTAKGAQCQTCHMPHEEHTWKGGHSPDMVKRAVEIGVVSDKEVYLPGETVSAQISVTNARAGHKFPSGGSGGNNRMVTVTASVVDGDGNVLDTQQFPPIMRQMKPPPEMFIQVSDNRLLPGETRTFDYSFPIPEEVEGQLYLNTQVAYFLTPPFLFEAMGAPELIEQFPPTIIHDQAKPLLLEKDYSNVFFVDLMQGLNMISLPLESRTPYTAQSLAQEIGATVVIKLNRETGTFTGYAAGGPGGEFPIEGGQGYIINVREAKTVTFTGAAWANGPSYAAAAPGRDASSGWAFVLTGEVYDTDARAAGDEYVVTAKNLRTGTVAVDTVKNSNGRIYFAAVWANLNRKSVIQASDTIEITVIDSEGKQVNEPVRQEISSLDVDKAFACVRLNISRVPVRNELGQNYPNPTNPETWIPFKLVQDADVIIRIHDISGKLVRKIHLGHKPVGYYVSRSQAAYWDGKNEAGESVSSGVYFYSIEAGGFTAAKKLLIAK
jgi:hypothetical protein